MNIVFSFWLKVTAKNAFSLQCMMLCNDWARADGELYLIHRHKSRDASALCHGSIRSGQLGRVDRPPVVQVHSWHLHCGADSELSSGAAVRTCPGRIYGVQRWLWDPLLGKQMPLKSGKSMWQAGGGTYLQCDRKHFATSPKHQRFNGSNYLQEKKTRTFYFSEETTEV